METINLEAKSRDPRGKSGARAARREGMLPAILYGGGGGPLALSLDMRSLEKVVASRRAEQAILSIKFEAGEEQLAMIKEIQNDTVSLKLLHVDLLRISLDKKVHVHVPLKLLNAEVIKKSGGILQQNVIELMVECLPTQIPENIPIEIGALGIGDSISVKDIAVGAEVTVLSDPDEVLLSVVAPAKAEEEKPVEAVAEGEAVEGEAAEGAEAKGAAKGAAKGGEAKEEKKPSKKESASDKK